VTRQLPTGWTVVKERFLYTALDPQGNKRVSGHTEESTTSGVYCLPEFGGTAGRKRDVSYVEL
jgi:hypothetical protein